MESFYPSLFSEFSQHQLDFPLDNEIPELEIETSLQELQNEESKQPENSVYNFNQILDFE